MGEIDRDMRLAVPIAEEDNGFRLFDQDSELPCAQQGGGRGFTVRTENERAAAPDRYQPGRGVTDKPFKPALLLAEVSAAVEATETVDVRLAAGQVEGIFIGHGGGVYTLRRARQSRVGE